MPALSAKAQVARQLRDLDTPQLDSCRAEYNHADLARGPDVAGSINCDSVRESFVDTGKDPAVLAAPASQHVVNPDMTVSDT